MNSSAMEDEQQAEPNAELDPVIREEIVRSLVRKLFSKNKCTSVWSLISIVDEQKLWKSYIKKRAADVGNIE